jgi:hypothetical protein
MQTSSIGLAGERISSHQIRSNTQQVITTGGTMYHVRYIITSSFYVGQDSSISKGTFYELNGRLYNQQEGDFSLCHCTQTSSGLPSLLLHDY